MKVAFVSSLASRWGGSELFWYRTARLALQEGHSVLLSLYEQKQYHPKVEELRKQGAELHARHNDTLYVQAPFAVRKWRNAQSRLVDRRPFEPLEAFDPDVVCVSLANTFDFVYDSKLRAFLSQYQGKVILQSNFNAEHAPLPPSLLPPAGAIMQKASACVFASYRNLQVAQHQAALRLPEDRVHVLRAPVDVQVADYVPTTGNDEVSFCSMARFEVGLKGQDLLLQALADDRWKARSWKLNFYGEGEDQAYIERLATFYGIGDRVHFHGYVSDLIEVWGQNDILLMPSFAEGTPIVLMIAMLCGRPAVVTDVAGNAEVLADDRTGFVAEAPTAALFDRALERAWQARDRWEEMGKRARETALSSFDPHPERTLLDLMTSV
ncbi:MAG: glycosyltransferase family 4 protein [Catalinimonas sp.]